MLTALVLLCLIGGADCTLQSAHVVLRVPEEQSSPMMCMLRGEEYAAAIGLMVPEGDMLRIVCVPTRNMPVRPGLG